MLDNHHMKKSLKKFIFEKLDKDNCVLDSDVAKFLEKDKEPNFYTISQYQDEYRRIKRDENFFSDKIITKLHHYKKRYLAEINGSYWKISKQYFNIIKSQFKKDNSRPDLKDVDDYVIVDK